MHRDEETQCACVRVLSNLPEASDSHSGSWSEHTDLQTAFSLENAPLNTELNRLLFLPIPPSLLPALEGIKR